jgi:CRP-like cAMP-binding protein
MSHLPCLPAQGIFASLSDAERTEIAALGTFIETPAGHTLLKQGSVEDCVLFLLEGLLTVRCAGLTRTLELGELKPGSTIGEMSFLDPKKASATVKAKKHSRLWQISSHALRRHLHQHSEVGVKVLSALGALLAQRLRIASDKMLRQVEASLRLYEPDA